MINYIESELGNGGTVLGGKDESKCDLVSLHASVIGIFLFDGHLARLLSELVEALIEVEVE